jgi:ubiquinone/menaquinone biosynthesis C-methylase UbiE
MISPLNYLRALKLLTLTNRVQLFDKLPHTKWYHSALSLFIEELKLNLSDTLLDVGCGTGWHTLWTSRHVNISIGLDISEKMLKRAEINLRSGSFDSVSLVKGNAFQLPFSDHKFNVVTGTMLLPTLPDPKQAISEMFRVLKPRGKLGLFVPTTELNVSNAKHYAREHRFSGFDYDSLITWPLTGRRFSKKEMNSFFSTHTNIHLKTRPILNDMAHIYLVEN